MIQSYLTDTVDILTRTVDQWGASTTTTQAGVKARVEDQNTVVRDQNGKEIASEIHIILGPDAIVNYQSFFKIKTRCGVTAEIPDKQWPVKKLSKGHGFTNLTWEVWL